MNGTVVALSGGIGGAKLVLGLARLLPPGALSVIANTGDDFEHLGLAISPDIDTLLYTLAGLADPEHGWGRRDETWGFMETLGRLGGETWFALGDRDLALHVERTRRLGAGATLAEVTDQLRRSLGIATRILPMSDTPVRTHLRTDAGWLDFQDYFVRRRCEPIVREIRYDGAATAAALPAALAALTDPALRAIVICPSNPLLSVGPMLALPALRAALQQASAPVIAVSPLIGGRAVKGPTAKLMQELGLTVDAAEVARGYAELIDVFVADEADAGITVPDGVRLVTAPTLMTTLAERERLAAAVLESCGKATAW